MNLYEQPLRALRAQLPLHRGAQTHDVPLCHSVGDPHCARMTEEGVGFCIHGLGVCASMWDSTGYCVPL